MNGIHHHIVNVTNIYNSFICTIRHVYRPCILNSFFFIDPWITKLMSCFSLILIQFSISWGKAYFSVLRMWRRNFFSSRFSQKLFSLDVCFFKFFWCFMNESFCSAKFVWYIWTPCVMRYKEPRILCTVFRKKYYVSLTRYDVVSELIISIK